MNIFERIEIRDVLKKTIIAATNAAHGIENSRNELTHAWIFEGPLGSGNTETASAFAASIICPNKGCGDCIECTSILSGNHLDVEIYKPKGQAIKIYDLRELINRSSLSPSIGGWRVIIFQEADNLTDASANALLGAIEDSSNRTIWILCANSEDEIIPTLRSRCRIIKFQSPTAKNIESYLVKNQEVKQEIAESVSKYAQGNLNRAKLFADNPVSIQRRDAILKLISSRVEISEAIKKVGRFLELSAEETETINQAEFDQINEDFFQVKSRLNQKSTSRSNESKDSISQNILDAASLLRDVLIRKIDSNIEFINPNFEKEIIEMAEENTAEEILVKLDYLIHTVSKLKSSASPQILLENMLILIN